MKKKKTEVRRRQRAKDERPTSNFQHRILNEKKETEDRGQGKGIDDLLIGGFDGLGRDGGQKSEVRGPGMNERAELIFSQRKWQRSEQGLMIVGIASLYVFNRQSSIDNHQSNASSIFGCVFVFSSNHYK